MAVHYRSQAFILSRDDLREADQVGVRLCSGTDTWEVLFETEGPPGGRVKLSVGGEVRVDRELTREVMNQAGLYGTD